MRDTNVASYAVRYYVQGYNDVCRYNRGTGVLVPDTARHPAVPEWRGMEVFEERNKSLLRVSD